MCSSAPENLLQSPHLFFRFGMSASPSCAQQRVISTCICSSTQRSPAHATARRKARDLQQEHSRGRAQLPKFLRLSQHGCE